MITSVNNKQIKQIGKLQKSSRERRERGLFVVEGIRMFREIPKDRLDQVFVSVAFYERHRELFCGPQPFELLSVPVFEKLSDTVAPQGVLATVRMKEYDSSDLLKAHKSPLILVLENIQDPGNLGTIFRTAEAAGVDGIMMSRDTADIYNPKTIRSTMGSLFRVPFLYIEDLPRAVDSLKENNITVYASHLGGQDFYQKDYRKGTAFLIGNEGSGLTDSLSDAADETIKIPMKGDVESLNAATAASLLVYEALRQRDYV